ncbi:PEP-CTERM sorting domain-containing protein [Rubellicoccus peritrichatus]|uniref:PEP-CTERM sorting domain-containing protein n=1 Tax=Rubellicoccus peritrichatus TaxID=3080537 RepID=A0AAQ3QV98_9BACT|nr:PEP-CTERM sorting domain-containing protein [Puniceicoccus sp. CR14]WOO40637.1 PEP-CTERM sorting domain-containing protein [Puniceicoccus sp. CR14]
MNTKLSLLLFASTVIAGLSASAQITVVDAVEGASGNTFATGGSLANTSWIEFNDSSGENNTQWRLRNSSTNNGFGSTAFQAQVGTLGSTPELTTQITGLADGVYDIYVFFTDFGDWNISAGLTSGSLTTYEGLNAGGDSGGTTAGVVQSDTLNLDLGGLSAPGSPSNHFAVNIGQTTVTGGSAINVFINHDAGVGNFNRTFYDAVGYAAVPEASHYALLLTGGAAAALLVRRKWRAKSV